VNPENFKKLVDRIRMIASSLTDNSAFTKPTAIEFAFALRLLTGLSASLRWG
jgi:hypothetical protein